MKEVALPSNPMISMKLKNQTVAMIISCHQETCIGQIGLMPSNYQPVVLQVISPSICYTLGRPLQKPILERVIIKTKVSKN